jgi:uncharacterized membrane protein
MKVLKILFLRLLNSYNLIIFLFLVLSFIGFIDSVYLTVNHYFKTIPPCSVSDCGVVLTSKYSTIFNIPVSLFGAIYYILLFILAVLSFEIRKEIIRFVIVLTPLGFLISLYFVYVQIFILKELCFYCLISAFISTILFIFSFFIIRLLETKN